MRIRRRRRTTPSPRVLAAIGAAALAVAGAAAALVRRARGPSGDGLEARGPSGAVAGVSGGTPDDARLLARVETEVLGDPAVPKGDVVLDAVGGVVTIRGTVPAPLVDDLPERVAAVDGVVRVDSRLRPPGDPPPVG